MLRALTWITLCLIWLDGFPTFVSYKLAWRCIYFGNQPVLCKSVSLILQEREIKGSVSVSNNEDKYLYFHNFWTSLSMASSQIMRSLLRQEHTDVIKFPTRLVRAWKNSVRGRMVLWFCHWVRIQLNWAKFLLLPYISNVTLHDPLFPSAPPKSPAVKHINLLGAEALSLWVGSCRNFGWVHEASQRRCRHENSHRLLALSEDQDWLHLTPKWWDISQKSPQPVNAQLCP